MMATKPIQTRERASGVWETTIVRPCGHTYTSASLWSTEKEAHFHGRVLLRHACSVCATGRRCPDGGVE